MSILMANLFDEKLCSGYGQFHSPNNCKNPQEYISITLCDISKMHENPISVDKEQDQWVIFSTLSSRVHAEQKEQGQFYALWEDIDEVSGLTFGEIVNLFMGIFSANFMAYTSRSATKDNQKTRIIVPLASPVSGAEFVILQKILNDKLQAAGITPDRATELAGQICYLPNRGEFYDSYQIDFIGPFDPAKWHEDVEQIKADQKAAQEVLEAQQEESRIKAAQRMADGMCSPIEAFNASYDLPMMLESCGYVQRGKRWLSPNSLSGVPGVTITEDGRKWISTHESDSGIGRPTSNGTMGDSFDLYAFFQHHKRNTPHPGLGNGVVTVDIHYCPLLKDFSTDFYR